MKEAPKILLVAEDPPLLRQLSSLLSAQGYNLLKTSVGIQAISIAASHCPQLVLLDPQLPDMDGLEVLDSIRDWSLLPVIILSDHTEEAAVVQALDRGADDYLRKPFGQAELLARIRVALRRPTLSPCEPSPGMIQIGEMSMDTQRHTVRLEGNPVHLTPIEHQILYMLASNAGRVLPHEQMLKALWGPHADDPQILRVNMANIRRKIEADPSNPKYILTETGVGYRMPRKDEL